MSQEQANEISRKLIEHPRWTWFPGLVFNWNNHDLIIVGCSSYNTVYAHFLGQSIGVELGIEEHLIIPNLLHPLTAGALFERWAREASYANLQVERFRLVGPKPNKPRIRNMSGDWSLIVDTGSQLLIHSDDELGVVSAEALMSLWRRMDLMTPRRVQAVDRSGDDG